MVCLIENCSSNCAATNCHKCSALKQSKPNLSWDSEFPNHFSETIKALGVLLHSGGPGRGSTTCLFSLFSGSACAPFLSRSRASCLCFTVTLTSLISTSCAAPHKGFCECLRSVLIANEHLSHLTTFSHSWSFCLHQVISEGPEFKMHIFWRKYDSVCHLLCHWKLWGS